MQNFTNKIKDITVMALSVVMAAVIAGFGLFVISGMLAVGLIALPIGALALYLTGSPKEHDSEDVVEGVATPA